MQRIPLAVSLAFALTMSHSAAKARDIEYPTFSENWKPAPEESIVNYDARARLSIRCWKINDGYDCLQAMSSYNIKDNIFYITRSVMKNIPNNVIQFGRKAWFGCSYINGSLTQNITDGAPENTPGNTIAENRIAVLLGTSYGTPWTRADILKIANINQLELGTIFVNCSKVGEKLKTFGLGALGTDAVTYQDLD